MTLCKLCGRDHPPSEPHIWDRPDFRVVPRETKREKRGPRQPILPTPPVAPKIAAVIEPPREGRLSPRYIPVKEWRAKNKDKYNAYMKDFMRRKRGRGPS